MKRNIMIIAGLIILAIAYRFIVSGYGQMMQSKMMAKGKIPKVTVQNVQEASVLKDYEAPGRIISKYRVDVVARINGYLTKSYFKEGDFVRKGQTLFQIEPQEWSYDLQKARATAATTRAQLNYSQKQTHRYAELVKKDYIARATYDSQAADRDALRAQLAMNQADINNARRNLSYTRVVAPVSGQVGMINVTVGNYVNESVGNLTTIYSRNPMYVTFPLDSKAYMELKEIDGMNAKRTVELYFPTGEKYKLKGTQNFNDNSVDESTGTITMRATFPNPEGELMNGEFVNIKMKSKNYVKTPIVPQVATMENPQGKYVYTIDKNGLAAMTMIKTSGEYHGNWIVESGLKVGDKVITDGIQKVIPGKPVKIVSADSHNAQHQANKKKHTNIIRKIGKWLHIFS
jgi:membrane fusion protein (multidrug efflux system)